METAFARGTPLLDVPRLFNNTVIISDLRMGRGLIDSIQLRPVK
jgi:hypothetical protein